MTIPRGILRETIGPSIGALVMLAALWALGLLELGPKPPGFADVVVSPEAIQEGEPNSDVGLVEGLVRPRAEPTVRATAPGAAANDVLAFCRAAGFGPTVTSPETNLDVANISARNASAPGSRPPGLAGGAPPGDPLPSPAPESPTAAPSAPALAASRDSAAPAPRSGLPPALRASPSPLLFARSGVVGWRRSEFWTVSSSGDLGRQTFDGLWPPVRFRADGDSLLVQGARFGWLRIVGPVALCAAGGYAALELDSPVPLAAGCGLGIYVGVR